MNAEALIGTVLGTSTLQQLIGQGGMGAVYLAQQSRPRRQVAVKVLMPATSLKPHQLTAFLERFRRETDAAASLEHPNIMPVYEYGERGGLAYLIMPYISGGTLRDVMEREGILSFNDAMNYLEQMAAALDFAHARGVIHRDIKPANMLLTPEGRLLLTDFGLVKLLTDNGDQIRLTGAGAPVGTPDYMSPEQVIGAEVDGRADQYSLGVVLYQMLTGTTPFQGETPMQIASQQLHMQPPMPRTFRKDLPEVAEQVLMRAMSKRSGERYTSTQEFAAAFRAALTAPSWGNTSAMRPAGTGLLTNAAQRKGSLFDPKWQNTGQVPAFGASTLNQSAQPNIPAAPAASALNDTTQRPAGTGLLSKTGLFPKISGNTGAVPAVPKIEQNTQGSTGLFSTGKFAASTGTQQAVFGQSPAAAPGQPDTFGQSAIQSSLFAQPNTSQQQGFATGNFSTGTFGTGTFPTGPFGNTAFQQLSPAAQNTTSALTSVNPDQKSGNTIKLTGPVKVVQVPVAPGQYVTGLLPIQKDTPVEQIHPDNSKIKITPVQKYVLIGLVVLLLIGGIGGGILLRTHSASSPNTSAKSNPGTTKSTGTQGTATPPLFSDPLTQNIHNFDIDNQHFFKDGAYHILNSGSSGSQALVVQQPFSQTALSYSLTMQEVAGNDTSPTNTFGLIFRYNSNTDQKGNASPTFYTFEILNQDGSGSYGFYKYDSSKADNPWTTLDSNPQKPIKAGNEFHGGHDKNSINTVKVTMNGDNFTFYVNGVQVATAKDDSYKSGEVGMIVNLKDTEVAFSNMLVTQ